MRLFKELHVEKKIWGTLRPRGALWLKGKTIF